VPVLISPFPEMKTIVDHYFIGEIIENHDPKHIAEKIDTMLMDCNRYDMYKENLRLAADELCWENEEEKLIRVIANQGTLSTPD